MALFELQSGAHTVTCLAALQQMTMTVPTMPEASSTRTMMTHVEVSSFAPDDDASVALLGLGPTPSNVVAVAVARTVLMGVVTSGGIWSCGRVFNMAVGCLCDVTLAAGSVLSVCAGVAAVMPDNVVAGCGGASDTSIGPLVWAAVAPPGWVECSPDLAPTGVSSNMLASIVVSAAVLADDGGGEGVAWLGRFVALAVICEAPSIVVACCVVSLACASTVSVAGSVRGWVVFEAVAGVGGVAFAEAAVSAAPADFAVGRLAVVVGASGAGVGGIENEGVSVVMVSAAAVVDVVAAAAADWCTVSVVVAAAAAVAGAPVVAAAAAAAAAGMGKGHCRFSNV